MTVNRMIEEIDHIIELVQCGDCIYEDGSYPCGDNPDPDCISCAIKKILALDLGRYKIGIYDEEAELPESPYGELWEFVTKDDQDLEHARDVGYHKSQIDMLQAGFRKVAKDEPHND